MFQFISLIILLFGIRVFAEVQKETISLKQLCVSSLQKYKSYSNDSGKSLEEACGQAQLSFDCASNEGSPIFHYQRSGESKEPKKILVISLIHGDETYAGALGRYWLERLVKLENPRNTWRVVPVANPDGVANNTRTNGRGVDLNRNFPTKDWEEKAQAFWKKDSGSSTRRFPGDKGGSEPEVKCIVKHIEEFQPDFVISIHTPLNVLDFDGPKLLQKPNFSYLPWKSLGNFPGSLGRYLWVERDVPTLTAELKNSLPTTEAPFEALQDLIGGLVQKDLKKSNKLN